LSEDKLAYSKYYAKAFLRFPEEIRRHSGIAGIIERLLFLLLSRAVSNSNRATSAAAFKYFSLSREIGMIGGGWLRARQ